MKLHFQVRRLLSQLWHVDNKYLFLLAEITLAYLLSCWTELYYLALLISLIVWYTISELLWNAANVHLHSRKNKLLAKTVIVLWTVGIIMDVYTLVLWHISLFLCLWWQVYILTDKCMQSLYGRIKRNQLLVRMTNSAESLLSATYLIFFIGTVILRSFVMPVGTLQIIAALIALSIWAKMASSHFSLVDMAASLLIILLTVDVLLWYYDQTRATVGAFCAIALLTVLVLYWRELKESVLKMFFWLPILLPWMVWIAYWTLLAQNTFWINGLNIKSHALSLAPNGRNANTVLVTTVTDLQKVLSYPAVMKPNICTTSNRGVKVVENATEAEEYYTKETEQFAHNMIVQKYLHHQHEFSIMYYRYPYYSAGKIKTLGLRRHNFDSIGQYSIEVTNYLITVQLTNHLDEYSNRVGWLFGRGDFRAKTFDHCKNASIQWLEINFAALGDISEKNGLVQRAKKSSEHWFQGFPNLFRAGRTGAIGVYCGVMNILMGNINFWESILNLSRLMHRYQFCGHHEHLWARE